MKAYQCKITGLWKLGYFGEYKYKTEKECIEVETKLLIQRLKEIREECQSSH